jgi:hypothetical protein
MESVAVAGILVYILILATVFVVGILGTVFWIWMLVDCATKERGEGNDKLIWVLIILFTHIIGAAIYYFVRRPKRKAEFGV